MTVAAFGYSNECFGRFNDAYSGSGYKPQDIKEKKFCAIKSMTAFDAVATITLLVVGILGATGVIALSPAASYGMIVGAGVILVSDLSALFPEICDTPNPLYNKATRYDSPLICLMQKNPNTKS